ncbi:MAG: ribonuclease [Clostridia bacterium]|nr:ribonuclease [Clostridia bacterium]
MKPKKLLSLLLVLLSLCLIFASCALSPGDIDGISDSEGLSIVDAVTDTKNDPQTEEPSSQEDTTQAPETPTDEATTAEPDEQTEPVTEAAIDENGTYTSKDDVALYIHTYGKLPSNFITKKEAEELGWTGGSLEKYAPGKCIGGTYFGNYEGILPEKEGRRYTECDIDTLGAKSRGAKRIVFSNDGLIYYTDDHYETFTLLYGEENS